MMTQWVKASSVKPDDLCAFLWTSMVGGENRLLQLMNGIESSVLKLWIGISSVQRLTKTFRKTCCSEREERGSVFSGQEKNMVQCEHLGSRVLEQRPQTRVFFIEASGVEGYKPAEHLPAGDFPSAPPTLKTQVSGWGPHASNPAWFGTWTSKTLASVTLPSFQELMVKISTWVRSIC